MAVAAAAVAILFVLVLIGSGYGAYRAKRPLIAPQILVFPAVAIVLSFAARRLIRDSEGTRTGELFGANLPNVAWWIGLVGILGYGTYLFAIDFSIRRDAEAEVTKWVDLIRKKDDPTAPDPVELAFIRTLEPGRRAAFTRITNRAELHSKLQAEMRDGLIAFQQTDLIRVVQRNPGETDFKPGGLRDWVYRDNGIDCVFSGTLLCPEGMFPVQIPLKGIEPTTGSGSDAAVGRQWQVVPSQGGFFTRERITLTPYGWLVLALERQGYTVGMEFISLAALGPQVRPYLYRDKVLKGAMPPLTPPQESVLTLRMAPAGGPIVAHARTPAYEQSLVESFFRLPGGADPTNETRDRFLKYWHEGPGIVPSGQVLRYSVEMAPLITITPTAVEVRVPLEIPIPDAKDGATARGRLLVVCTDPGLLAELKALRASAKPEQGTAQQPEELKTRAFPWQVVRVESDMYGVRQASPTGPGGGPQPGPQG